MRGYTTNEKVKTTAGPVAALVIVAWLVVLADAFPSGGGISRFLFGARPCQLALPPSSRRSRRPIVYGLQFLRTISIWPGC
jgi:hypothetical protein